MNPRETMTQAAGLLQNGRAAEAEPLFRSVLAQWPGNPDALHLLGCALSKLGKSAEAIDLIQRAISFQPNQFVYQHNLGLAFLAAGRRADAVPAFARALLINPAADATRVQLGNTLNDMGQFEKARECFVHLTQAHPAAPMFHYNLGNTYFREATSVRAGEDPDQMSDARRTELLEKAVACYEKALSLDVRFAPAGNNLAMVLWTLRRPDDAIAAWRRNAEVISDLPSWYNLGRALSEQDRIDEALDAMQRCIRMDPKSPDCANNLGNIYRQRGQIEQAIAEFDRAIALQPQFKVAQSNRLYTLYYQSGVDSKTILTAHRHWNDTIAAPLSLNLPPHGNDRDPDRRLKIGYVSPNFWGHCQSLFTMPLWMNHDREKFEIHCYSDVQTPDPTTAKIRGLVDQWHSIVGCGDDRAAHMIRNDRIDILVDLTVHMAENRMLLFAGKPAPVQVTWLGYPGTTGLRAIDYRFTDPYLDPPGEFDDDYVEKSVRLPHTFWCLDREALEAVDIPPVNDLPAAQAGRITFGCLNNFCKVNEPLLKLWRRVLDAVPDSRFLILSPAGQCQDWVREHLGDRVDFVLRNSRTEYLKYYHRIDIGLDTLPYNGHTTTLDSLWMGVPVISLMGETVVGRAGFSQYSNLDLTEPIAKTPDEFVRKATALAGDIDRLTELRRTLRGRMRASPLLDGATFTRGVEAAYREIWRQYCLTTKP